MTGCVVDRRVREEDSMNLNGVPVKILLGIDEQSYFAHPSLLIENSGFFKAALKEHWLKNEGQKSVIRLVDDDPAVFKAYMEYLYSGKILVKEREQNDDDSHYYALAQFYGFGEKMLDFRFQDCVMDAMIAYSMEPDGSSTLVFPSSATIDILYRSTPRGSPGRALLVDMYARKGDESWMTDQSDVWHSEFTLELSQVLMKYRELSASFVEDHELEASLRTFRDRPCQYHKHDVDKPCDGKKD